MAPKKKSAKKKVVKRKAVKKPVKKQVKKAPARKKAVVRKAARKKVAVKKPKVKTAAAKPLGVVIGSITHYFPKVRAAVIKLKAPLSVGDVIWVKGHTTDFKQTINSMQLDHVSLEVAKKGQEIGLLVTSRVRQHDIVYKG